MEGLTAKTVQITQDVFIAGLDKNRPAHAVFTTSGGIISGIPHDQLPGDRLALKRAQVRRSLATLLSGAFSWTSMRPGTMTIALPPIDPVLDKIEQLLSAPAVRATVGTVTSSIDFAAIMDERKILIANLSKGVVGPSHAQLLGSILVSGFSHAAMARAVFEERVRARVAFFLFADEIQNFATESFGEIASEARKMKLGLVLGHQYLQQLPHRLRAAILGNVGSIVAFQLSGADGDTVAAELGLKRGDMLSQLRPQDVGQNTRRMADHTRRNSSSDRT
jgi:hypothetical protein